MAEPVTPARRRNRPAWIAAAVFVVAVAVGVVALLPVGLSTLRAITSKPIAVPGTTSRHLSTGDYLVMPHSGTSSQYGPLTVSRGEALAITGLEVVGPGGTPLELTPSWNTTLQVGGDSYQSVARFHVAVAGDHTITSESTSATTMVVVKDPFDGIAPRVVMAALSAVVALAAGIWWIVALVRGSRSRRDERLGLLPPPGA